MALIRCLHFITARFNIALSACHLPGSENAMADALSRNKLSHFFSLNPQANRYPCPIPAAVINLLTKPHLDWTSQAWRETFSTSYFHATLSKNTQHSYSSAHHRYINFCSYSGLIAYPSNEDTLCKYVSFLGQEQLKHQTVKSYLSGIRYYNIEQSHPDPFIKDMPRLQYILRGIKLEESKAPASPKR